MPACRSWSKPETRCANARGDSGRCARLVDRVSRRVSAAAQDSTGWHRLEIPGGRATLRSLGVADNRERSAVMVELIRRFLFATTSQAALESSLRKLPAGNGDSVTVPLPLAPAKWSAVFERTIPPSRLFAEILLDPSARLLFHGLAGLDRDTRTWIEGEDDLLRRLYRNPDALKSFALFAPALQVSAGRVELPGGSLAEQRWSAILNARPDQPSRFGSRLFEDRDGRTAGLFATIAFADEARRGFLLGASGPRFAQLVSGFAQCYPAHSNDYPIALRSHDPALLLLELAVNDKGEVAGPTSQRFWEKVFDDHDLSRAPDAARSDWRRCHRCGVAGESIVRRVGVQSRRCLCDPAGRASRVWRSAGRRMARCGARAEGSASVAIGVHVDGARRRA